jgi:hypothetical protein
MEDCTGLREFQIREHYGDGSGDICPIMESAPSILSETTAPEAE